MYFRYLVLLLIFCLCVQGAFAQEAWMPDANLRSGVRSALGKGGNASFTKAELASLTELKVTWADVSDLTGLEHATGLTELKIWGNSFSDIDPLEDLPSLEVLKIALNESLRNVDDLGKIETLTHLAIQDTSVSDIDFIRRLDNLVWLRMNNCPVSDADLQRLSNHLNATSQELDIDIDLPAPDLTGPTVKLSTVHPLSASHLSSLSNNGYILTEPMTTVDAHEKHLSVPITGVHPSNFVVIFTFSELVRDFYASDIQITGGTIVGEIYAFNIDPVLVQDNPVLIDTTREKITKSEARSGTVKQVWRCDVQVNENTSEVRISVPAGVCTDKTPINNLNQASTALVIPFDSFSPYDVNEDGSINLSDLAIVVGDIGKASPSNARSDVNGDGSVNVADLQLVVDNLDNPTTGASPELIRLFPELRLPSVVALRPVKTELLANYPNPFNPETWIPYHLAAPSEVKLTIYDVRGKVVRELGLGHQPAGYYISKSRAGYWDGKNRVGEEVASGVYFYRLEADNTSALRKLVILK